MRKNFPFTKTATELTYLGKAKELVTGVPLVGKYIEAFGKGAGKGIEALETVSRYPDRKYGVNIFNDPQFNQYVKDSGITKDYGHEVGSFLSPLERLADNGDIPSTAGGRVGSGNDRNKLGTPYWLFDIL